MRGLMLLLLIGIVTAMTPGHAQSPRITVGPSRVQVLKAKQQELVDRKTALENEMRREYASYLVVRKRAPVWNEYCNKLSAAEIALEVGKEAWLRVAKKRAPADIKGIIKLNEWFDFVKTLKVGGPDVFATVFGNNFKCRAKVSEAYARYYMRLQDIGNSLDIALKELERVNRELSDLESAPGAGGGVPTGLIDQISPKDVIMLPGGDPGGKEVEEGYYACFMGHPSNRLALSRVKTGAQAIWQMNDRAYDSCIRQFVGDYYFARKMMLLAR